MGNLFFVELEVKQKQAEFLREAEQAHLWAQARQASSQTRSGAPSGMRRFAPIGKILARVPHAVVKLASGIMG